MFAAGRPNQASLIFVGKASGQYYKCFTIAIYDHNDSGQYYKTTTTIVIDDRNWQS